MSINANIRAPLKKEIMPMIPSGMEWIFLAVVVGILFFGVKKVPELARSFGRARGEYDRARIESQRELEKLKRGED